jgi:hypothetical protein
MSAGAQMAKQATPTDPILKCMQKQLDSSGITRATLLTKWPPDPIFYLWKHCSRCISGMPYWYVKGQAMTTLGDFIGYVERWKANPTTRAASKKKSS